MLPQQQWRSRMHTTSTRRALKTTAKLILAAIAIAIGAQIIGTIITTGRAAQERWAEVTQRVTGG